MKGQSSFTAGLFPMRKPDEPSTRQPCVSTSPEARPRKPHYSSYSRGDIGVSKIARRDFKFDTVEGVNIAIREFHPKPRVPGMSPMVLMHGTRIPGIIEYDLPVPGGSLAESLALAGHTFFIPDARVFG